MRLIHPTILTTLYNAWETIHAELESVNDSPCDTV